MSEKELVQAFAARVAGRVCRALAEDCRVTLDEDAVQRVHGVVAGELGAMILARGEVEDIARAAFRAGLRPDDDE